MQSILGGLKVAISSKIYLKDPETSDLGKKIIEQSILLIDEIGFDNFTFKKLGEKIGSNESSIYRYFENKHKLLLYLTSWYWGWMEFKLVFTTNSISDPIEKLTKTIIILTEDIKEDVTHPHINEVVLSRIVICEFSKSYLTKEVDEENKEGYFMFYKRVITRLIENITAIKPDYLYPKSLASMIVDGALHQHFLKNHFTSITDCSEKTTPTEFFTNLVFKQLS
ncbi:TetR/AcrR family transcriptional regulator [Flavobacterium sp. UBA6135]|uniref:TetR/AcrR family transcriptional regulator n=1 Tax=Flavobacterium sp. UBA6135 TaxID=1946553 RepID=UPI0025B7AAA0|nr:TetR/AcrR family transcriptional regulator [Flavobacterium sp. UBA6135]